MKKGVSKRPGEFVARAGERTVVGFMDISVLTVEGLHSRIPACSNSCVTLVRSRYDIYSTGVGAHVFLLANCV